MKPARKLAYDVGVNVAANLIAAAIVYLIGVYLGLFPIAISAQVGAAAVVIVALCSAVFLLPAPEGKPRATIALLGVLLLVVAGTAIVTHTLSETAPIATQVLRWGVGAVLVIGTVSDASRKYRRERDRVAGPTDRGLKIPEKPTTSTPQRLADEAATPPSDGN